MTPYFRKRLNRALLTMLSLLMLAGAAGGCRQPNTAPTSPVNETTASSPAEPVTSEELSYFAEVALGSEYGETGPVIHKWSRDLRIKVKGSPTAQDNATLDKVISEINSLVEGVQLKRASWNDNVKIYFVPESRFSWYESNYVPTITGSSGPGGAIAARFTAPAC